MDQNHFRSANGGIIVPPGPEVNCKSMKKGIFARTRCCIRLGKRTIPCFVVIQFDIVSSILKITLHIFDLDVFDAEGWLLTVQTSYPSVISSIKAENVLEHVHIVTMILLFGNVVQTPSPCHTVIEHFGLFSKIKNYHLHKMLISQTQILNHIINGRRLGRSVIRGIAWLQDVVQLKWKQL